MPLACDIWWGKGYVAVSLQQANGSLPSGTGAADGAHELLHSLHLQQEKIIAREISFPECKPSKP